MPLYEYECEKCGHTFEHLQRSDDPPPTCSKETDDNGGVCGGEVKRKMSRFDFQLKGGGWAADGYSK